MMTRRAALLACALLLLAAAPCARAALLTPCDDGMGGADGGGDLQKTTPTSANARWLLPLVDKVARDQGTLDLLFKPRKGCKLTGFTFDNKMCVPKSGKKDRFRFKVLLKTAGCGSLHAKYRVQVSPSGKPTVNTFGRSAS